MAQEGIINNNKDGIIIDKTASSKKVSPCLNERGRWWFVGGCEFKSEFE